MNHMGEYLGRKVLTRKHYHEQGGTNLSQARTRRLNNQQPVRGAIAELAKGAHKTAQPSRWRRYLRAVTDNFPALWVSFTAPVRSRVKFESHIRKARVLDKFADSLRSPPGQPDPDIACGDAGKTMRPTGPRETAVPVQGACKRVRDRFRGHFHWVREHQTTRGHRGSGVVLQNIKRQLSEKEQAASGQRWTINRGLKRARGTPGAPLVGRDDNAALNIGDCYDVVAGRAKEEGERPWYLRYREEDRRAAHDALLAAQA